MVIVKPEALVSIIIIIFKLNVIKIKAVINSFFKRLKATIASVLIKKVSPFFIISLRGVIT